MSHFSQMSLTTISHTSRVFDRQDSLRSPCVGFSVSCWATGKTSLARTSQHRTSMRLSIICNTEDKMPPALQPAALVVECMGNPFSYHL